MFAKQNVYQVPAKSLRTRQQPPPNLTRTDAVNTYRPVTNAAAASAGASTESSIDIAPSKRTAPIGHMQNQRTSRNGYENIDVITPSSSSHSTDNNVHTYIYEIGMFSSYICRRKECIPSYSHNIYFCPDFDIVTQLVH